MPLNEFLDFLRSNPFKDKKYYIGSDGWLKTFEEKFPDWRDIVNNPENWNEIEKIPQIRCIDTLWIALLKVVGVDLAIHWFDSQDEDRKGPARKYLQENLEYLDSSVWKKLNDKIKKYIIDYWFDNSPGEPFASIRKRGKLKEPFQKYVYPLYFWPQIEYIPSISIRNLREIVKNAGDKKYLKYIDELIEERKVATSSKTHNFNNLIRYNPSSDERELIARAMKFFLRNGYKPKSLPEIYLSMEAPPIFVAYPELEEFDDNNNVNDNVNNRRSREEEVGKRCIPRDRQRGRPEIITIEELLGGYIPNPKIILWVRGIDWLAKRKGYDRELLQAIVLLHEIGHWITHQLPKNTSPGWETNLYVATEKNVHEGWAQLITYWVLDKIGGEIKDIFDDLSNHQSSPYKVYEKFIRKNMDSVLNSLEALRNLKWPARLTDWENFVF